MDRTHVVYRCYDADEALIYVGVTGNLRRRRHNHKARMGWWADVAQVTSTRPMTMAAALRYERMTIRAEQPKINVLHKANHHGTEARYVAGCRCRLCIVANNDYTFSRRRIRETLVAVDPSLVVHGLATTYSNWRCRCDDCTAANRVRQQIAVARRRAS